MWQKKKDKKSYRGTVSREFAHIEVSLLKNNIIVFTLGEEYFPKISLQVLDTLEEKLYWQWCLGTFMAQLCIFQGPKRRDYWPNHPGPSSYNLSLYIISTVSNTAADYLFSGPSCSWPHSSNPFHSSIFHCNLCEQLLFFTKVLFPVMPKSTYKSMYVKAKSLNFRQVCKFDLSAYPMYCNKRRPRTHL